MEPYSHNYNKDRSAASASSSGSATPSDAQSKPRFQPAESSGFLFSKQSENPRAPAYSGSCMINGQLYEIAAWFHSDHPGKTRFNLKFKLADKA